MSGQQVAFDVFVSKEIQRLQSDVKGRSAKAKELRSACTALVEEIQQSGTTVAAPLPAALSAKVLQLLDLASEVDQDNVRDICASILHKLVAHAWLQGSTPAHAKLDEDNVVATTVRVATRCSECLNAKVQLSTIRLVLTLVTSEHFVAHGEVLVQCLKIVINLALATEDAMLHMTSCNALLQMCNTILRRTLHSTARAFSSPVAAPDEPERARAHAAQNSAPSAASGELGSAPPQPHPDPPGPTTAAATVSGSDSSHGAPRRTAELFALAEQNDLRGLEAAIEGMPSEPMPGGKQPARSSSIRLPRDPGETGIVKVADAAGSVSMCRTVSSGLVVTTERSGTGGPELDVLEADVVLVMCALCRLAARHTNAGSMDDADVYRAAGKALAADVLLKVLENEGNPWSELSSAAWSMLRQPLCMVMLRSASSATHPGPETFAPRLFLAVLTRTPLRLSLKAEMGAFFPLLLHHPLESEAPRRELLMMCLRASIELANAPQLLVDIFVNYDCDLQAVNVFERWVNGLRRVAIGAAPGVPTDARHTALNCVDHVLRSLDALMRPVDAPRSAFETVDSTGVLSDSNTVRSSDSSFEATKILKDRRASGVQLFETKPLEGLRQLQEAGIVGASCAAAALWIRKSLGDLNRDAVGELFGMMDDFAIGVMHEYIDHEDFQGLTPDEALRRLLHEFKLPGEAQQIDRIMEKFAECYVRQNPDVFRVAEDAYRLAFATIMLNTDVHNPMADHMLSLETFVEMNTDTLEDGSVVTALPVIDLKGIFDRVSAQEIQMIGRKDSRATGKRPNRRMLNPGRLAAALGLATIIRSLQGRDAVPLPRSRSGSALVPMRARLRSATWYESVGHQHVRHMLQVCSTSVLEVLKEGLRQADAAYNVALDAVRNAIRLASRCVLHSFCEDVMSMLCSATGVYGPGVSGSALEARQLQALKTLLDIALGPEGLTLGSSWWLVLRCVSSVEFMVQRVQRLTSAAHAGTSHPSSPNYASSPQRTSAHAHAGSHSTDGTLMGGLVSMESGIKAAFGGLSSFMAPGSSPAQSARPSTNFLFRSPTSPNGRSRESPATREAALTHGAALVAWAASAEGADAITKLYERSEKLDGENVVVFIRALCAVSNQELQPLAGAPPRTGSLQHLSDCLSNNMGRIRLVWGRIWAVAAPHFVAAACHEDLDVAMMAVNSLKNLVGALLQRSELSLFAWQQLALTPFLSILRHSGDPSVRGMILACLQHFMQKSPALLGSGWTRILEALELALTDVKLTLVEDGLKALATAMMAVEAAGVADALLRPLLALSTLAAMHQAHPHLCFAALKCIQQLVDYLSRQRIGMTPITGSPRADSASPASSPQAIDEATAPSSSSDPGARPDTLVLSEGSHLVQLFPWAFSDSIGSPWVVVHEALAHIACYADNDSVAEQGVEEAMRLLHKLSPAWSCETLNLSFRCVHRRLFAGEHVATMQRGDAVTLPPRDVARLLARVRTYLPSLATLLIAEYSALGAPALESLLSSLLCLLHIPSMDAVRVGVAGLHQLSVVLGGQGGAELDAAGWGALADMLACACTIDTAPAVPQRQRLEAVVLVQRSVAQILQHCGRCMPPTIHLRLLSVLRASVLRACEVNVDPARRIQLDLELRGRASSFGEVTDGASPATAASPLPSPSPLGAAPAPNGATASPPHSNGAVSPFARDRHQRAGARSSKASPSRMALVMEQQNAGARLLLKACMATIQAFRTSATRHPALVEAAECAEKAETLFLELCETIVVSCGDSCDRTSGAENDKRTLYWTAEDNATVLCDALRLLRAQSSPRVKAQLQALLPHLCQLIKCGHASVRAGVADTFDLIYTTSEPAKA